MRKSISLPATAIVLALGASTAFAGSGISPPMNLQALDWGRQVKQQEHSNQGSRTTVSFDQLDLKQAGYVTRGDSENHSWLSRHFRQCDTNGDEQVSRAEYAACTTRQ
ncbi:hypothetical protein [Dokdonella sp.]|uniref:hypothetical protein n=1 Tax=Dokdonella sp. TaxID=2291710 RepID=UPI001B209275|nr:hypothetical protein [Dokdonella sp.]MBO9664091.1 hypothetical protein [Dokdonella sp.]